MRLRKFAVAAFFAAVGLFASGFALAQIWSKEEASLHPKSIRGSLLAYANSQFEPLNVTESLPPDGSLCEPYPPVAPSPGYLPPFSVVRVLDQRSFVGYQSACVSPGDWPHGTMMHFPLVVTWYRVIAIEENGAPRRTTDGQTIEGWAEAKDFEAAADPFAVVAAARQRAGGR